MPQLAPRKVLGLVLVVALTTIVGLALATLVGSGAQLRALLPAVTAESGVAAPAQAEAPSAPADAPIQPPPFEPDDTLDETHDEAEPRPPGPVSGAEFSRLLEDGALGETDAAAAEELRRALAETEPE